MDVIEKGVTIRMCGIAGIVRADGKAVIKEEIQSLINYQKHRGPDGEGIWLKGNIALGHRRLSIIDIEGGAQPFKSEDGTRIIVYNGEIYNYLELKKELAEKGAKFRTRSDTEVVLWAYQIWGQDCCRHLRGMFAFAIVDMIKQKIFIARDHFGIKPVVYYYDNHNFAFASEIQALKTLPFFSNELSGTQIDKFLCLQYIPAPDSIFEHVKKMLPGTYMEIGFDGKIINVQQYYKIPIDRRKCELSEEESIAEFDCVLRESVRHHTISDVPVGCYLSGGIDSTLMAIYMAENSTRPIDTFSIGFTNDNNSDLPYAKWAAQVLGTNHHLEILQPDTLNVLDELVPIFGEPYGESVIIPYYYLAKMTARSVKVTLTGDGGDEIFCGYPTYAEWSRRLNNVPSVTHRVEQETRNLIRRVLGRRRQILYWKQTPDNWTSIINFFNHDERVALWKEDYRNSVNYGIQEIEDVMRLTENLHPLRQVQLTDIKTYLANDILVNSDISTMWHGVEARTPIIDSKVVEFAMKIPVDYNVGYFKEYGLQYKLLLKKLLLKRFPESFVFRPKRGFSSPLRTWLFDGENISNKLIERIRDPQARIFEYFNYCVVESIIQNKNANQIWLLLVLEYWLEYENRRQTVAIG